MTFRRYLEVACPYCEAKAGEVCRTFMGTIDRSNNPHSGRLHALKMAQKAAQKAAQADLFGGGGGPETGGIGFRWERRTNGSLKVGGQWLLLRDGQDTGYLIEHCGHPTANYPYTGTAPDGSVILAPNGRGFMRLALAQADVLAAYLKGTA